MQLVSAALVSTDSRHVSFCRIPYAEKIGRTDSLTFADAALDGYKYALQGALAKCAGKGALVTTGARIFQFATNS